MAKQVAAVALLAQLPIAAGSDFLVGQHNSVRGAFGLPALRADSFTEGTPIEYEDSFVGLFEEKTGYKTANLGIVSYSPKIYLSKINFLLKEGFKFDHVVVFIDNRDTITEIETIFD